MIAVVKTSFRQFDGIAQFLKTSETIARMRDDRVGESIRRMNAIGETIRRVCFVPAVNLPSLKI